MPRLVLSAKMESHYLMENVNQNVQANSGIIQETTDAKNVTLLARPAKVKLNVLNVTTDTSYTKTSVFKNVHQDTSAIVQRMYVTNVTQHVKLAQEQPMKIA